MADHAEFEIDVNRRHAVTHNRDAAMVSLSYLTSSQRHRAGEILAHFPFEFDAFQVPDDISWLKIEPASDIAAIASDYTGGCYVRYGTYDLGFRFLHASSEGVTTQLATTLNTLVATIVAIPNWMEVAHWELDTMREQFVAARHGLLKCHPDFESIRDRLAADLNLDLDADLVGQLHESILDGESLKIHTNGEQSMSILF